MAKSKKKSKKDEQEAAKKAAAKARAKAAAKAAALADEAKKARKAADKAVKAAEKAEAKAFDAGVAAPKPKADETELLRLALRSAEAKLTDAERRIELLETQIADLHRVSDEAAEEALEDAIVDAAVAATVEEAVAEAELAAPLDDAVEVELVAAELEEIVDEAALPAEEPSHEGEAEAAAEVFTEAEPAVTGEELTPPLPEQPADDRPNASWTLLRLRQEARSRGLSGTSNLPKAALLQRLTATDD
jgi:hypothetical protein